MCNVFFACKKSDAALDVPLSDLRRHKIISEGEHNMNYTKNYRLPQWVKEDRIMMDDFNAMNSSIESGLTRTDAKADSAVSAVSTANTASAKAGTAQQTADAAKRTADAAFSPNKMPYRVGSYVGNGSARTIHLGFRPSFLIISGAILDGAGNNPTFFTNYTCITAGNVLNTRVTFTDTGFTLTGFGNGHPDLTWSGRTFDYIAFR